MEEEMISLCNIMPVELAIKRELEYRTQMLLKNQHQNDLKPLVLPQGAPTRARKEDVEVAPSNTRKTPMLQFSSSSRASKEKIAFSCKVCQLTFASVFHLSSYIGSQLHKNSTSQLKKRKEAISNPYWCESCRSSCSSLGEIEAHLNGSRHNSMIAEMAKNRKKKKL